MRVQNPEDILVESYSARPASLRICIVTETFPPEVNGVAMTLGKLVDGMLARGHLVQLVRPRQPREFSSSRAGLDEVLSRGLKVPAYNEMRFGLPAKGKLIKLWSQQRPDVVHVVTEGPLGWSAVAAARKLQLPVTSSFHTNFHSYSGHYGIGILKKSIEGYLRKLHNRTQATMVPTKALMKDLESRGYQNVRLLSRGVNMDQFQPFLRSQELRKAWGADDSTLVVTLVGRLAKEKNIELALKAFTAIRAKRDDAKLVLVGDGPLRAQLAEQHPDVIFAGSRRGADLAAHYASADMFIFPSLTETFGNVVPEALASGLPVLAYACAAAQELITNGSNGYLVDVGNEAQFTAQAVVMALDVQKLQHMQNAAAPSVSHLAWSSVFDSFEQNLQEVLAKGESLFVADPAQAARAALISNPSA